ncbi:MAG: response regulator [Calditrichia bacterium]|nr:response regulator [Calditrichia bacterium]
MADKTNKILVIDDENAILLMMNDILEILGYEMDGVMTVREGLEKVVQDTYDFIICDLSLPDSDGREFFKNAILKKPEIKGKVVFSSGYLQEGELQEFCEINQIKFLSKPFKVEDIQAVLK